MNTKTTTEETQAQYGEEQVDEISIEQLRAVLGGVAAEGAQFAATCGDYNVRV